MIAHVPASLAAVAVALSATGVHGHSNMILPLPTWPVSYSTNSPSGLIEGETYLPVPSGMSYSTDPASNTEAYWTAFNASNYTSLLQFADATQEVQTMATFGTATKECGFSLANGTARALPAEVEWNQLTSSHEGPCEVWCDDTRVFEDWNCAVDYTTSPAKLPYDASKCEGAKMLTSIWLALHALPWQVYTNCAPLSGASSAASSSDSDSSTSTSTTTTTSAPFSTTATPSATTAAPTATTAAASKDDESSTEDDYDTSEDASTDSDSTTKAPTASTAATTSTMSPSKCSVRSRRRD